MTLRWLKQKTWDDEKVNIFCQCKSWPRRNAASIPIHLWRSARFTASSPTGHQCATEWDWVNTTISRFTVMLPQRSGSGEAISARCGKRTFVSFSLKKDQCHWSSARSTWIRPLSCARNIATRRSGTACVTVWDWVLNFILARFVLQ